MEKAVGPYTQSVAIQQKSIIFMILLHIDMFNKHILPVSPMVDFLMMVYLRTFFKK